MAADGASTRSTMARRIMVGAAIGMLLCFPIDWSTADGASGDNPFHYPMTGGLAWLLVVGAGVAAALLPHGPPAIGRAWSTALVAAPLLAAVLLVVQLIAGGRTLHGPPTVQVDRGPGMWLALIAALVSCAGALTWLTTRDPGGA